MASVAVVGVGVALALVRVELDRRASRARREERRFGLLAHERPEDGLRRMALGQLDLAVEMLEDGAPGASSARTVHETRKALKRLRALVRLLRHELGEQTFARENATLRDAGRRLAGARDSEVTLSMLDTLTKRSGKLGRRGVKRLRRELVAERDRAVRGDLAAQAARAEVLAELRSLRERVAGWSLPELPGIELLESGLRDIYEQGRRRLRRAARAKDARLRDRRGRALHEWRKRVKDLRYAAEMLDREGSDRDRAIRRMARRADRLGEMLGEEHDLGVLAERVNAADHAFQGRKRDRKALLKEIARRRGKLRKRALRDGGRLYRRKPKRFARDMRREYARAAK
jgi:CHAD domain-containing protein